MHLSWRDPYKMQIRSSSRLFKPFSYSPQPSRKSRLLTMTSDTLHYLVSVWFSYTGCFNHTELFTFPDWGFAFPPQSLCRRWPLLGAFCFLVFLSFLLPQIPKLIPYLSPLSKYHLFLNPSLTTSSPNWGKGLSMCSHGNLALNTFQIILKCFCLYVCPPGEVSWELWMYLFILPHQCLTQWSLQTQIQKNNGEVNEKTSKLLVRM